MKFGDIYWADLPEGEHIQSGRRPVIILGNPEALKSRCPTVQVLPLSSQIHKAAKVPTHVLIEGLQKPSFAVTENISTVPRRCILGNFPVSEVTSLQKQMLKTAITYQLGIC